MRRVKILIRYFDSEGELVFEGEPNLRHATRVPMHWTRWEIYWDEELVQAGERPQPDPERGERRGIPAQTGQHGQRSRERGHAAGDEARGDPAAPSREARPAALWWA